MSSEVIRNTALVSSEALLPEEIDPRLGKQCKYLTGGGGGGGYKYILVSRYCLQI